MKNQDQVRDIVRSFLPTLMCKELDDSIEKTNKLLNPLIEDGSIDGFDTSYSDADLSFAVDVYYLSGLCDTFTLQPDATVQENLS